MFDWLTRTKPIRDLQAEISRLQEAVDAAREWQKAASAQIDDLRAKATLLGERNGTIADRADKLNERLQRAEVRIDKGQECLSAVQQDIERGSSSLAELSTGVSRLDRRVKVHENEAGKVHAALVERIEAARRAAGKGAANPD